MRSLILAAGVTLALATPALAQNPNPEQGTSSEQSSATIQQKVKNDLAAAGYTDIQVMPRSFLVQAKDKSGNSVTMFISPHAVTTVRAFNRANSQSNVASGQPVKLTPEQRVEIQRVAAGQPAEQAPPNFQPSVGEKVPDSVTLQSLPSSASSDLPTSLHDAQFAKLNDNNIILADPSSREVVAVINQNRSQE